MAVSSGHSLRLPTLSRYLTTAYTFYTATTLTACTLLLETTADYITGLGRLAKQQNLLSFLLESSTTSAAAKEDQNEVVKEVGPVYAARVAKHVK